MRASAEPKPAGGPSIATGGDDAAFDSVRKAFHARLNEDLARFVALRQALKARRVPAEAIVAELRNRSHKLRGGAAIFEMRDLTARACAVEEAAIAASAQVKSGEEMLDAPLAALVELLQLAVQG